MTTDRIARLKKALAFDDNITLKGLLLEMKLAPTSEERILAEEIIVNQGARTAELDEALVKCVGALIWYSLPGSDSLGTTASRPLAELDAALEKMEGK